MNSSRLSEVRTLTLELARTDPYISRIQRVVVSHGERAIPGDAVITARVEMPGKHLRRTIEWQVGELGIALIRIGVEDAFAVASPARSGGVAIEFRSHRVRIAAIAVGDV